MTLIGWWPLHERSGTTAYDLSGNGNDGTLGGGTSSAEPTQAVAGKAGLTAYSFDGSDDYISLGTGPYSPSEGTWSIWLKTSDTSEQHLHTSGDRAGIYIGEDGNGIIAFRVYNGSSYDVAADSANRADGNWHHAVGTHDGNTARLYVNGAEVASTSSSNISYDTGRDYRIGAEWNGTSYFNGELCDARIYDRALTQQEILSIYRQGNADVANPPGNNDSAAVSRWSMDTADLSETSSTTSRPQDDSSNSKTTKRGLEFNPNKDLTKIEATVGGQTEANTVYLHHNDGTLLDSTSTTGSGDTVTLEGSLSAGTNYYVTVDSGGSSYTNGWYGTPSFPYTGSHLDITAGAYNDPSWGTTTNNAYTISDITGFATNIITDTWGSNNGTAQGDASSTSTAVRGQAYTFDGNGDYIDIGNSISIGSGEISVSLWYYTGSSVPSNQYGTPASGGWFFNYDSSNPNMRWDPGGGRVTSDLSLQKNTWYHLVGTGDGSITRLFINGTLDSESTGNSYSIADGNNVNIGRRSTNGGDYIEGKIDEVRIYNRALDPWEIQQLYQYGTCGIDMRKHTVNRRN